MRRRFASYGSEANTIRYDTRAYPGFYFLGKHRTPASFIMPKSSSRARQVPLQSWGGDLAGPSSSRSTGASNCRLHGPFLDALNGLSEQRALLDTLDAILLALHGCLFDALDGLL